MIDSLIICAFFCWLSIVVMLASVISELKEINKKLEENKNRKALV